MFELEITNIILFFGIVGVCLLFVVTWIVKAEARTKIGRAEIKKLRLKIEACEREKFVLTERIAELERSAALSPAVTGETFAADTAKISKLEEENRVLRDEVSAAKASLEEVYKALTAQG